MTKGNSSMAAMSLQQSLQFYIANNKTGLPLSGGDSCRHLGRATPNLEQK
jgi:hypothetical protein